MASLFAHAAIPLVTKRAFDWPKGFGRRLAIAATLCAVWPDVDLASLAWEVRPTDLLGHRGLTHSIPIAALVSAVVALVWFRALGIGSRAWRRVLAFLFGAAASHGLLDAMTTGDAGVALFAPFENGRHMLPLELLPSCPVGLDEYLGAWGFLTLANEILYVVVPLGLLVTFSNEPELRRRMVRIGAGWLIGVALLRWKAPQTFTPTMPRRLEPMGTGPAGKLEEIPHADLPNGSLVTRLTELRDLALFDKPLTPEKQPWSSSFFPSWFGAEGGRWQEGSPTLVWRTMFGFAPPSADEARAWLTAAAAGDGRAQQRVFTLAPTEKLDLAFARLDFPATKQALARSHNARPRPRYWFGRCNGVSGASITLPEPFRVVDVISPEGFHIHFHPNDVKSLLALAYDDASQFAIGEVCTTLAFDAGATCSMNPAVLVLTALNRIGIAKRSFVIDALPTIAKQYYGVVAAQVHLAGEPRPAGGTPMNDALAGRVDALVDVDIVLTLSSTTLAYARANVVEKRVGVVPVLMKYKATLAIDSKSELVGGMWRGNPADGPDNVLIVGDEPELVLDGRLHAADQISWAFLRELARASADEEAPRTIDLRPSQGM